MTHKEEAQAREEHKGGALRPVVRRAGIPMILLFVLIPPAAGCFLASVILAVPGREPWVITIAYVLGVTSFLLATPLGRRSDGLRVASYRRLTEASVLLGLTCGAMVVYTIVVHIRLGIQVPWATDLLSRMLGG
ncbi:MAG: hypothetical protein JSU98_02285 [Gemmatimonadales bacterium]|nr:MAG: hypothetical protein JSU98_02285 [Gemmatimonadales bacterium]